MQNTPLLLLRTDFDHAASRTHLFADFPTFAKKVGLTSGSDGLKDSNGSPSFNHCWMIWGPATPRAADPGLRQHSNLAKDTAEKVVKDIRRATRKQYSAEEKIRIVLEGLRGEDSIVVSCAAAYRAEPVLSLVKGLPEGGRSSGWSNKPNCRFVAR